MLLMLVINSYKKYNLGLSEIFSITLMLYYAQTRIFVLVQDAESNINIIVRLFKS